MWTNWSATAARAHHHHCLTQLYLFAEVVSIPPRTCLAKRPQKHWQACVGSFERLL